MLGLVLIIVSVSDCTNPGHAEGDRCVFGCDGVLQCTPTHEDCKAGLYCNTRTEVCTRPIARGQACNPACAMAFSAPCNDICAEGLQCDLSNTCQPPGPEGTLCTRNLHCAQGLSCNHGYLPDDVTHGECHPPSGAGQPCSYAQYEDNPAKTYGCVVGLMCVPQATPTRATFTAGAGGCTDNGDDPTCGFAGICTPPYSAASGEACLGPGGCANGGLCYLQLPPTAVDGTPAFACNDGTNKGECWTGPWPGLCGPGPTRAPTYGNSCITTECAPGYLCGWTGVCSSRWSQPSLARCDTWNTAAPNDDFCKIGLRCAGDPPRCVPP